jgi:hypothetical protein
MSLGKASMKKWKKTILLVLMGLLEIVFLSLVLASNVPRRSADLAAFSRYQSAPTPENRELWLKERQITQNEVDLRRFFGAVLGIGNLFLMRWVAKRRIDPSLSEAPVSRVSL